ncbi:MAG: extracellular solute-binding protein, partial [Lentilitoribacter sp.]
WVIPKGTPNKELAMDFLAFSTATEQLAKQASYISYGPARKSSAPLVGKFHNKDIDMGPQMPTAPENLTNATQNNFDFWADNADQLNERFNAWLTN